MDICYLFLMIFSFCGLMTCLIILPFVLPKAKMLKAASLVNIAALRPGYYAVRGKVLPMELIRSPITNKFCVYCNDEIQVYTGGKNKSWVTEKSVVCLRKFMLVDDSAGVLVNPSKAEVDLPHRVATSTFNRKFRALLAKHGVSTTGWFGFTKQMRCLEKRIEPDMKLTVIGTVTKDITLPIPTGLIFNQGQKKFVITPKTYREMRESSKKAMLALYIFGGLSLFFLCIFTLMFIVSI